MKYVLHLPKQPVLTVFDLQAVHHTLPQLCFGPKGTRMNQRNCRLHPPLRSTAQCCSSQYFTQYFELLSDWTSAHHWFFPRSPRRSPEEPRATGGPSTPPSRPPLAFPTAVRTDRGPRATESAWVRRPSRPVAIGTCPATISFPRLPRGTKGPGRVARASLIIFIVQVFTTRRLVSLQCNTATMVVWLNRTKL